MLHAPWYNSNTAHQGEKESVDMMAAMETLLYQHNVDILFAGHVHAYERNVLTEILLLECKHISN
jgi:UDP-2,3-diacylglucosamine pyrophosphatase LpxH